jgi:putative restriction endonuclease
MVRRRFENRGHLTSEDLGRGFQFEGVRVPLVNPQRGIFKPRGMKHLLSIRTVVPRAGARVWYDDQREAHKQIFEGDQVVDYAFMGTDAAAAENGWLRAAMVDRVPVIYFLGTAPGIYQPIVPTFVSGWDAARLKATMSFGLPWETGAELADSVVERRYALRLVKARLHQETFRSAVIAAYDGRCALSGLRESRLLDAAHIAADKDEEYGQPVVTNGLPLSKLHHAAFDAQLIGISPDYRVHVSDQLLSIHDGPTLEALKRLDGGRIILPDRKQGHRRNCGARDLGSQRNSFRAVVH